jgi:hypothetical protein
VADSAGGVRLGVNLNGRARKRGPSRPVVWLVTAAVIVPLMVLLHRGSPGTFTAVSVGVKVVMGVVFLWGAVLARQTPVRGRGIPLWLQMLAVALVAFLIAALQAREALG